MANIFNIMQNLKDKVSPWDEILKYRFYLLTLEPYRKDWYHSMAWTWKTQIKILLIHFEDELWQSRRFKVRSPEERENIQNLPDNFCVLAYDLNLFAAKACREIAWRVLVYIS